MEMGKEENTMLCLDQARRSLIARVLPPLPKTLDEEATFTDAVERRDACIEKFFPLERLFPPTRASIARWWEAVLCLPFSECSAEQDVMDLQYCRAAEQTHRFLIGQEIAPFGCLPATAICYRRYNCALLNAREAWKLGRRTLQEFLVDATHNVPTGPVADLIACAQYRLLCTWRFPAEDNRLVRHAQELQAWIAKGAKAPTNAGIKRISHYFNSKGSNLFDAGLTDAYQVLSDLHKF